MRLGDCHNFHDFRELARRRRSSGATPEVWDIGPIGHESGQIGKVSQAVDGRQTLPERQSVDPKSIDEAKRGSTDIQCVWLAAEPLRVALRQL
jgi:hypothetical protein